MKIAQVLEAMQAGRNMDHPLESVRLYYDLMARYYARIEEAERTHHRPLVILGIYTPIELFYAMDIVPCHAELHAMNAACLGGCQGYFDTAAAYGTPIEACSIQRAMIGMAKGGLLPTPDFIVSAAGVCDSEVKSLEVLVKHFGCPYFLTDMPYQGDPAGVAYYLKELEALVPFLESQTGRPLDWGRLEETVELSRQAAVLYRQVNEARKACPSPMRNQDFFNMCTVYAMMAGTQEAVDYFEVVAREVREQVEGKRPPLRPQERFRLSCAFCFPAFSPELLNWMEQEHGAAIAIDLVNYWRGEEEMDARRPLESLAKKAFYLPLAMPFIGPVENWSRSVIEMGRGYSLDGSIFFAPVTCKEGCATIRILKDRMREEAGIPTLVADCDMIDPSVVSEEELKGKLEGFFETLEAR